jgi:hypothetical protein
MRVMQVFGRDSKAADYSIPEPFRKAQCVNFGGVLTLAQLNAKSRPELSCASTGGSLPPQLAPIL